MLEEWKTCTVNDYYEVSSLGRIRRQKTVRQYKKGTLLSLITRNKYGHKQVKLCRNGKIKTYSVHRLVLEAFVGPCRKGYECAHLDGDPSNNQLSNLRWVTHTENCAHRKLHGTDSFIGQRNPQAKLSPSSVRKIRELKYKKGWTAATLAARFGVSRSAIYHLIAGNTWRHIC